MSLPTSEQANALLAARWTPEQLCESKKAGLAVSLYRDGPASLDDAAEFAAVPKARLLEMMTGDEPTPLPSKVELGRDAERYVTIDPRILSGTPCLKGTRVPAHYIADMVENGDAVHQILAAYPSLTEGRISAAVAYTQAFPRRARPEREPAWREQQPIVSREIAFDDLPPPS